MTKIYGASDDLVEIDGDIQDEYSEYDFNGKVSASDGTLVNMKYDENGEWKFDVIVEGKHFLGVVTAVGEDNKHTNYAEGCTPYSDVLLLDDGIEWVKIGKQKFK